MLTIRFIAALFAWVLNWSFRAVNRGRGTGGADGAAAPCSTFPVPPAPSSTGHPQPNGAGSDAGDGRTDGRTELIEQRPDPKRAKGPCAAQGHDTRKPGSWGKGDGTGSSPGPSRHARRGLPERGAAQPLAPCRAAAGCAQRPQSRHGP